MTDKSLQGPSLTTSLFILVKNLITKTCLFTLQYGFQ